MEHTLKDCMRKQWENRPSNIVHNDVMFSAPREPPRKPTGFQSWGDRDETTEHFFIAIKKAEE